MMGAAGAVNAPGDGPDAMVAIPFDLGGAGGPFRLARSRPG